MKIAGIALVTVAAIPATWVMQQLTLGKAATGSTVVVVQYPATPAQGKRWFSTVIRSLDADTAAVTAGVPGIMHIPEAQSHVHGEIEPGRRRN